MMCEPDTGSTLAGSHAYFGFRPDLVCQCKAIANTYPLSVVLGVESLREGSRVCLCRWHLLGRFFSHVGGH